MAGAVYAAGPMGRTLVRVALRLAGAAAIAAAALGALRAARRAPGSASPPRGSFDTWPAVTPAPDRVPPARGQTAPRT